MEPSLICTLGRTSDQFERQGTGYALYLQSGPTPDNRISVPVTEAGALNDVSNLVGLIVVGMKENPTPGPYVDTFIPRL